MNIGINEVVEYWVVEGLGVRRRRGISWEFIFSFF